MKKGLFILLALWAAYSPLTSLKAEPIGTWKAYMAYHDVQEIEKGGDILYVLASNNLYSYNTRDKSITTYDKVRQLSDCNIDHIAWNQKTKRLFISYNNFNIDLLSENGEVENISDYMNKSITSEKTIYSIDMYNEFAYVSTGFGIMKINMAKGEISETYNLGYKVNYSYIQDGYIYAASSTMGIMRALLKDNLLDKSKWTWVSGYIDRKKTIDPELLAIVNTLSPDGPQYNEFGFLKFANNKLYTSSGVSQVGCIQVLDHDKWTIYEGELQNKTGYYYKNIYGLAVDPFDENHVFAGTQSGVYEFRNGQFVKLYNSDNSPLTVAAQLSDPTNKNFVMVTGIEFDKYGNLWCLNSISRHSSLTKMSKEGQWTNYHKDILDAYSDCGMENIVKPIFDSKGLLWFTDDFWRAQALISFNPTNEEFHRYSTFITEDGATLNPSGISTAIEDLENNIWVGTILGPLMLETDEMGKSEDETIFTQVKVPRNDGTNLADYLLADVEIRDIKIDGGGRKWFATNGVGVYLISADNMTQIHHFTESNSGLLSNSVISIAINYKTGEVFFGTNKGLCSYMSDAVDPSEEMTKDNVYAYPNPVRPEYKGLITVTGLTFNADIKIVTTNGVLVAQGKSNGGIFTWDGNDLQGNRVASGVYLVQTATQEGESGTVCKIAIVN